MEVKCSSPGLLLKGQDQVLPSCAPESGKKSFFPKLTLFYVILKTLKKRVFLGLTVPSEPGCKLSALDAFPFNSALVPPLLRRRYYQSHFTGGAAEAQRSESCSQRVVIGDPLMETTTSDFTSYRPPAPAGSTPDQHFKRPLDFASLAPVLSYQLDRQLLHLY